jgi:hypothetical protein
MEHLLALGALDVPLNGADEGEPAADVPLSVLCAPALESKIARAPAARDEGVRGAPQ